MLRRPALIVVQATLLIFRHGALGSLLKCSGYDEEFGVCPDLPSCDKCVPVDCVFGPWKEWNDQGGCAQLKQRSRSILTMNNECGKPCSGTKVQSERFAKPECDLLRVDCQLSDWSAWTGCSSPTSQAMRTRSILRNPRNGGAVCSEQLKETKACGVVRPPTDCYFTSWEEWTACSTTCGKGQRTRLRRIGDDAQRGGQTCSGTTVTVEDCNVGACSRQDCVIGAWSEWTNCDFGEAQKFRQRGVLKPAIGDGDSCKESLKETAACPVQAQVPCKLSEYSPWSVCDRECGGGQQYKKRRILTTPLNGGTCKGELLELTRPCNTMPCHAPPKSCVFSDWKPWGPCDVKCGSGSSRRERVVLEPAENGGQGCIGPLSELMKCEATACDIADCEWAEWQEWSACTCSCDGGTRHRMRVIKQSPIGDGKLCEPSDKAQAEPCNTAPCERSCRAGEWTAWSEWSDCSDKCDGGYRVRKREVARPPDTCGPPLEGQTSEFAPCEELPACVKDVDCKMSEWGPWSDCSCSCDGVMERSRYIEQYVQGNGRACNGTMREMSTCHPTPGEAPIPGCSTVKVDCVMGPWSAWTACSRTCGGGQQERSRDILTPASGGGEPCKDVTEVTEGCNQQSCDVVHCLDCLWNQWSEWDNCSPESGQRFRTRTIEQMPNACGKMCSSEASKEIQNCTKPPTEALVCRWTAWNEEGSCDDRCGPRSLSKSRALGFAKVTREEAEKEVDAEKSLFFADEQFDVTCTGSQVALQDCGLPSCDQCVPQDCRLNAWSHWSAPSFEGLCERKRDIKTVSNHCGEPCQGILVETKECGIVDDQPVDCELDVWTDWTACASATDQKTRQRKVKHHAQNDGKPCEGRLSETIPCSSPASVVDCKYSEWTKWDDCLASCGGSTQERTRQIVRHATPGGIPCSGDLKQVQACNMQPCDIDNTDCKLSEWSGFSECGADNQRYRHRHVVAPASGDGRPCEGSLEDTETCPLEVIDCKVSQWTDWGECDEICGGGQQHRVRQIHEFPKNGGVPCPSALAETQACNVEACSTKDCELAPWQDWTSCSATCGVGQQTRHRDVREFRSSGGSGCGDELSETRGCNHEPCEMVDCEWDVWNDWSACSSTCGGGQMTRSREIRHTPVGGGAACAPVDKEEIAACNTQACTENCIDGSWTDWMEWTPCTVTCGGGSSMRVRNVASMANECGTPASGSDQEVRMCETQSCHETVDCEFSEWTDWSGCSTTCDGIARRSRVVKRTGSGDGAYCEGPIKQTKPCNLATDPDRAAFCGHHPAVDCQMREWTEWSECTLTCGGGTRERFRAIAEVPRYGGKICDESLRDVEECNRTECPKPEPVDCELGDWSEWGACSHCDGSRKRFRHMVKQALHGGKACPVASMDDVGPCPEKCEEDAVCGFGDWEAWGKCSATCGAATRKRRRELVKQTQDKTVPASMKALMAEYSRLDAYTQQLEAGHSQELALAFVCGLLALTILLGAVRLLTGARHASGEQLQQRNLLAQANPE